MTNACVKIGQLLAYTKRYCVPISSRKTHVTETLERFSYFLPKKDMMLPCPGLPTAFLTLSVDDAVDAAILAFCGGGSSSEKDSQAGSSFVTVVDVSVKHMSLSCGM